MLRVLFAVDGLPPRVVGGTPLVAWDYARALAARGWAVGVVTPIPGLADWPDERSGALDPTGFERFEVPATAAQGIAWALEAATTPADPAALEWFARHLAATRPDVVHVLSPVDMPLEWPALARRAGIPVVRSVTGPEDLCGLGHPTSPLAGPAGYCAAPLSPQRCAACVVSVFDPPPASAGPTARRAYHQVVVERTGRLTAALSQKAAVAAEQYLDVYDKVIFSTPGFRRYFEQTLPLDPSKVEVVKMGLAPADPPAALRPPEAVSGEPRRLVALGLIHPTKGVAALAQALAGPELVSRAGRYRFTFHGGGTAGYPAGGDRPDEDASGGALPSGAAPSPLDAVIAANPAVSVAGPYGPDDVPGILAGADVGLSASRFETSHRVTREYLRAGVPVVGSLAWGIPDVVHHGVNGLLFDHADPPSLTRALIAVIDDDALVAALTAGARSTRVADLDTEIDRILDVYASLRVGAGSGR